MPAQALRRLATRHPVRATLALAAAYAVLALSFPLVATAATAAPATDCAMNGDLTTLMSTGTIQGRSDSGFVTMGFDSMTGVAYVPHFVGGHNVITSYKPSTQTVVNCAFTVSKDKKNSHNGADIAVDTEGYVHVVSGRHGSPPLYERSAQPHDPTFAGGMVQPPSLLNDQLPMPGATYPQIFANPSNPDKLIVLARERTPNGNAQVEISTSSDHGDTWTQAKTIVDMTASDPHAKVYPELSQAPDGTLHLVFTPHKFVIAGHCGVSDNRVIYYAKSTDFGATWTKADGTPLTLPMTAATADQVVAAATPAQRVQAKLGTPMAFDAQGNPIVIYRQWDDRDCTRPDDNPAALEEVRWTGTAWSTPVAVNADVAHTGYLVSQLSDHNIIEVYATRLYDDVPILTVYRSTDRGQTWSAPQCLDSVSSTSLVSLKSNNQTQSNEDLIEYGSGSAGYLLDRTVHGNQVPCPSAVTSRG